MDQIQTIATAAWTALVLFVTGNIEPMPGVIMAAGGGALLSVLVGPDRQMRPMLTGFLLAACVGIFVSQLAAEFLTLKFGYSRVAFAFFAALFGETTIAAARKAIADGSIWKAITGVLPWRK